jgi:hypothetical protein
VEDNTVSARDDILGAIRAQRVRSAPRPSPYVPPPQSDLVTSFAERARTQFADVRALEKIEDIPATVSELLRGKNMPQEVHVAPDARLPQLAGIAMKQTVPGPNDAALTTASFVAFPSRI